MPDFDQLMNDPAALDMMNAQVRGMRRPSLLDMLSQQQNNRANTSAPASLANQLPKLLAMQRQLKIDNAKRQAMLKVQDAERKIKEMQLNELIKQAQQMQKQVQQQQQVAQQNYQRQQMIQAARNSV